MKVKSLSKILWLVLLILAIGGCQIAPEKPAGILSVAELLEKPVYDQSVQVFGQVGQLGELLCPCFILTGDGMTLEVWYDLMAEDNGALRPAVSVEGIHNGDWVVVFGELKSEGVYRTLNDFWASHIVVID